MGRPDDEVRQIDQDVLCWSEPGLGLITVADYFEDYEDYEDHMKTVTLQLTVEYTGHDNQMSPVRLGRWDLIEEQCFRAT